MPYSSQKVTSIQHLSFLLVSCRLLDFLGGSIIGILGSVVDTPVILLIALYKCPFMLFKGWCRLFHDLISRKGPFLETICVPFAGLAILLWPLAVVGALVGSIISGIFLGAYAGVIVYQVDLKYTSLNVTKSTNKDKCKQERTKIFVVY